MRCVKDARGDLIVVCPHKEIMGSKVNLKLNKFYAYLEGVPHHSET
jgi:hypothetical protein